MLKKWFICLSLFIVCFNLSSCAWWSQNNAQNQANWHNINQISASLYQAFPETPTSHIQVTYDHMALYMPHTVSILEISMYLPASSLQSEQDQQRVRQTFHNILLAWHHPNIECLTLRFSEHLTYFDTLTIPLKQVWAELTCG